MIQANHFAMYAEDMCQSLTHHSAALLPVVARAHQRAWYRNRARFKGARISLFAAEDLLVLLQYLVGD